MRPARTKTGERTETTVMMRAPDLVSSWPPLAYRPGAYVSLLRSLSIAASFGGGGLPEGVDPLEELLVDDEDHSEYEERENRRDRHPDQPFPALLLAGGDPALDRRQPEGGQGDAER